MPPSILMNNIFTPFLCIPCVTQILKAQEYVTSNLIRLDEESGRGCSICLKI
uniref:Uncharacterized protein n=1 Tax=Moniliophthora roreri TaxID=221103 RepID=A0A0W0EWL8_MONRR